MEIDNKRINLTSSKNPYSDLFLDFFSQKKKNFTSIEYSILAWKIINKIESRKPELKYYTECFPAENMEKI
jgi:glucose-6-phosphate 1-dehydrogenase